MEEREKLFLLFERQTFLFPYFPATQFLEQKAQSANTLSRQHISKHVVARIDTHLLALHVPVPDPLAELRPPILEHIRLRVFDTLAVAKAALSACGGDHVNRVKIDFQPLAWLCGDLQLRAPGTSVALLLQPARVNIYTEITGLLFLLSFLFFFLFFLSFPPSPSPSWPRVLSLLPLFPAPLFPHSCSLGGRIFLFFFFPSPPSFFFLSRHPGKRERRLEIISKGNRETRRGPRGKTWRFFWVSGRGISTRNLISIAFASMEGRGGRGGGAVCVHGGTTFSSV